MRIKRKRSSVPSFGGERCAIRREMNFPQFAIKYVRTPNRPECMHSCNMHLNAKHYKYSHLVKRYSLKLYLYKNIPRGRLNAAQLWGYTIVDCLECLTCSCSLHTKLYKFYNMEVVYFRRRDDVLQEHKTLCKFSILVPTVCTGSRWHFSRRFVLKILFTTACFRFIGQDSINFLVDLLQTFNLPI